MSSSITKAGKDDQVDQEQAAHGEDEKDDNVESLTRNKLHMVNMKNMIRLTRNKLHMVNMKR